MQLARLGFVSRTRVTQIIDRLNLAPAIQESLLFLHRVERGRDPVAEWELRRSRRRWIGRGSGEHSRKLLGPCEFVCNPQALTFLSPYSNCSRHR
jgi:hypothetical protein